MDLLRSQVTKGDVHRIIKAIKGGSDYQMIIGRTYTPSGKVNVGGGNNRDEYRIVLTSGDEYAMYRDAYKQELLEWYDCDIEYIQNTHFSRAEYEVLKSVNLICKISIKLVMYFVILYNILHRRGYNGRQHYYIGRKTSNKSK